MKEALFYRREGDKVRCELCPHRCLIAQGKSGICRVREHHAEKLIAQNYGQCTSMGMDAIEKKPLYHFYPGTDILSVGTKGCNFKCKHCQNWTIAHDNPQLQELTSEMLVDLALKQNNGYTNVGIAYTYSEPSVWYEFVLDSAKLAKEKGLKNVLVTNAFIEEEPLLKLLPYVDALNIDIKGFTQDFYEKICCGSLEHVLHVTKLAAQHAHMEITTLVIPGLNDSPEEIRQLATWLTNETGPDTPLHLSRYFPNYQMDITPTPIQTLEKSREIAMEQLRYVYIGNVGGSGSNTYCPQCKELVIERTQWGINMPGIEKGTKQCRYCGFNIALVN